MSILILFVSVCWSKTNIRRNLEIKSKKLTLFQTRNQQTNIFIYVFYIFSIPLSGKLLLWGFSKVIKCYSDLFYKQPSRAVLRKRCSENMQQIYKKTLMPNCDFNKLAKQLYRNCISAWLFCYKFGVYFKNIFL